MIFVNIDKLGEYFRIFDFQNKREQFLQNHFQNCTYSKFKRLALKSQFRCAIQIAENTMAYFIFLWEADFDH